MITDFDRFFPVESESGDRSRELPPVFERNGVKSPQKRVFDHFCGHVKMKLEPIEPFKRDEMEAWFFFFIVSPLASHDFRCCGMWWIGAPTCRKSILDRFKVMAPDFLFFTSKG